MHLTIHRGTHEIGGSCVELCSNSGKTRIIIDLGMPLVNGDMTPFEWKTYQKLTPAELIAQKILPNITGLYEHEPPSVTAVLLSHAHQDHYGLMRFVHADIPLYMSKGTKALAEVSNVFFKTQVKLNNITTFPFWKQFPVGEFTVEPYLMDHSAPDAAAFVIEGDGKRIFYTGDFRGHGRKGIVLDRIINNPPANIDYLIMEGSMLGRDEGEYPDEDSIEQAVYEELAKQTGPYYIFTSSQNLDRFVSVYRAAKRAGKTIVIDLYQAFVLDKLSILSEQIPQFHWEDIKLLYVHSYADKIAVLDINLLKKYKPFWVQRDDILPDAKDEVIFARNNYYFRNFVIRKLANINKGIAIYSQWHGYLERDNNKPGNLQELLDTCHIPLVEIHTSGHAYISQLQRLAAALHPHHIIPIHTFYPEKYPDMFPDVIQLKDGQICTL